VLDPKGPRRVHTARPASGGGDALCPVADAEPFMIGRLDVDDDMGLVFRLDLWPSTVDLDVGMG
jgi:hypothetical protein